jgi:fused signal recognition particle receptor
MPHPAIIVVVALVVVAIVVALVVRTRRRRSAGLPPEPSQPVLEAREREEGAARVAPAAEEGRKPAPVLPPQEPERRAVPRVEEAAEATLAERVAAKAAEAKAAETKPAEETAEAKPAERVVAKAAEKPAEARPPERVAAKAAEKAPEAKAAEKAGEAKPAVAAEEVRKRVAAVRRGLEVTRGGLVAKLKRLFQGKKEISPDLLKSIEEVLVTSDVGVRTTDRLVARVREGLSGKDLSDERLVWAFLREEARAILDLPERLPSLKKGEPYVILVLGVNGVGKTTTIGKLAARHVSEGRKVVLAAADTFRAAAVSQLQIWGRRVECETVCGKEGADPSSVAFAAIEKARAAGADVVIVDTAGRLHTKVPLMEELKKIHRVVGKAQEGAPHEVLLTLDANTGQNAIQQATTFREAVAVTGIVLTKLDGTAKGGVILGICDEQRIPVRFIGVGEGIDDLRPFDPELFVSALFDDVEEISAAA